MTSISHFFETINNALGDYFAAVGVWFTGLCAEYAYPVLIVFFKPINTQLAKIHQPWFTIVAVGFFISAMLWVGLVLREDYVNVGRPKKTWYTDLRLWTVLSMLPHVFVYFYFY